MTPKPPRDIDSRYKFQTDSLVEIKRGLLREAERLSDEGLKHNGHLIRQGNLLNALVTWFLGRPEHERTAIATDGLAFFMRRLHGESTAAFEMSEVRLARTKGAGGSVRRNSGNTNKAVGKNSPAMPNY